jgi:hypothetical protein
LEALAPGDPSIDVPVAMEDFVQLKVRTCASPLSFFISPLLWNFFCFEFDMNGTTVQ